MTAIEFDGDLAVFHGVVGIDDAELLLEWLQRVIAPRVNFSECTHLHPANLQLLMAVNPEVNVWPKDGGLANWLQSAFTIQDKEQ